MTGSADVFVVRFGQRGGGGLGGLELASLAVLGLTKGRAIMQLSCHAAELHHAVSEVRRMHGGSRQQAGRDRSA